jgi:hypothetical protein
MNTRWLVSLLLGLLVGVGGISALRAQTIILPGQTRAGSMLKPIGPLMRKDAKTPRPSHRPINTGLADNLTPEEALAARLRGSRDLKSILEDERFKKELQKLAERLLKDRKFLRSLEGKFSPADIDRLREKIGNGQMSGNEKEWKDLFEKGKLGEHLNENDKKLFERWKDKFNKGETPQSTDPKDKPPSSSSDQPGAKEGDSSSGKSTWDRWEEKSADWFKDQAGDWVKHLNEWSDSPSGTSWREAVERLAKMRDEANAPNLTERARGLGNYLPKVSHYLPRSFTQKTPQPPIPSLPRFGALSKARLPGLPSAPDAGSGKVILWMIVLGLLALVLWRSSGFWQRLLTKQDGHSWNLGPWPVQPGEVTTRADLVRAFEHLALLCLGPAARTCHHLDLGERIGEQPAVDPDRRRDSAQTLAQLYEQARYTPDDETLPVEKMASARRELCYLAGVAQA